MATEVSSWARHGTAPVIGPFRAIEAEYLRTGGAATWGEPVRKDLSVWIFRDGCIAYDPRDERAHELRGASYRDFCDAIRPSWT
ncbi:MAG: hypothetical protein ABWX82_13630 [Leifsonia sp.]